MIISIGMEDMQHIYNQVYSNMKSMVIETKDHKIILSGEVVDEIVHISPSLKTEIRNAAERIYGR